MTLTQILDLIIVTLSTIQIEPLMTVIRTRMSNHGREGVKCGKKSFALLKISETGSDLIKWEVLKLTQAIMAITVHGQRGSVPINDNSGLSERFLEGAPYVVPFHLLAR